MTNTGIDQEIQALATIETEVNTMFLERSEVVRMAFLALFAKQHAILIGPPGTGKSALIREIAARFCDPAGNGLRFFYYQLHKLTQLDELVGPVSFEGMKDGTYQRVIEGSFVTCELAFLDEIWKTSSAIHNAMLRGANERMFKNGIIDLQIPLNTIFGASNELPEGNELAAARDRYLFTAFVPYLSSDGFKLFTARKMGMEPNPFTFAKTTLTKDAFYRLQEYARSLPFSRTVVDTMCLIRQELADNKIEISDRRAEWCYPVMQANAMMEGRTAVDEDDFAPLIPALWMEPSQIKTVASIVNKHSNPTNAKASEYKDSAEEVYRQALQQMQQNQGNRSQRLIVASEAAAKLEEIKQSLETMQSGLQKAGKQNKKVAQALAQVSNEHRELLQAVGFK